MLLIQVYAALYIGSCFGSILMMTLHYSISEIVAFGQVTYIYIL